MALALRNLSVLCYSNGFTLWNFKTAKDSLDSISRSGYFNAASDMLSVEDIIVVVGKDGARMLLVSGKTPVVHGGEDHVTTVPMS